MKTAAFFYVYHTDASCTNAVGKFAAIPLTPNYFYKREPLQQTSIDQQRRETPTTQ